MFELELWQLMSREASCGFILSDTTGIDVPSLLTFLEILFGANSAPTTKKVST